MSFVRRSGSLLHPNEEVLLSLSGTRRRQMEIGRRTDTESLPLSADSCPAFVCTQPLHPSKYVTFWITMHSLSVLQHAALSTSSGTNQVGEGWGSHAVVIRVGSDNAVLQDPQMGMGSKFHGQLVPVQ